MNHRIICLVMFSGMWCISARAEVPATAPATQRTPQKFGPSWREQAEDLHAKKNYAAAKQLFQKWLEANPRDAMAWYDLACSEALLGEKSAALDDLDRAVDAGYSDARWMSQDADLVSLRTDARFTAAVARIEQVARSKGPSSFIRRFAPMQTIGTYIVMLPSDYQTSGKAYPLCVILHGNGSTELAHGTLADKFGRDGVIYIAVQAPHPRVDEMLSGTEGWTASLPNRPGDTDPALEQNRADYVEWIMQCAADAAKNYRIQNGRFFIYGHSQGGQFAVSCALAHPDRIAAVFSEAGSLPSAQAMTDANLAQMKAQHTRVHLLHGEQDDTVEPEVSKTVKQKMDAAGVECTLKMIPGGHAPSEDMVRVVREWIDAEVRSPR